MNSTISKCGVRQGLGVLVLLAGLATLIYSDTFSASFQFDDWLSIADNGGIRRLSRALMDISESRYAGYLSFAINYSMDRLNVVGYHVTNLLIHVTNGFLVYVLVSLLGRTQYQFTDGSIHTREKGAFGLDRRDVIALAAALLFVAHPIQTQAVTYIVQRFTSLAALFYLLAVVCYLKWRLATPTQRSRYRWYGAALVATVLAMKTKENSFTLPFMLILIEGAFFRPAALKAWRPLVPFLFTLPIIPWSVAQTMETPALEFPRETTAIPRLSYLFTQFRVIVTYLRLLILPIHQNLDYDYPIYHSVLATPVLLSLLFLLSVFGLALYLLIYRSSYRLVGFGIAWFFVTLSIESSIVPISDVIFEHRLYLPSAGFLMAGSVALMGHRDRLRLLPVVAAAVAVISLSVATYQRNLVWKDELSLWSDTLAKSPGKARVRDYVGLIHVRQGRLDQGIAEILTAIRLDPDSFQAHIDLGDAYLQQGRTHRAIVEYETAVRLTTNSPTAHISLGNAYLQQGRFDEAVTEFTTAVQMTPNSPTTHINLGNAYLRQNRLDEAVSEFTTALHLNPDASKAQTNLGYAYLQQGRVGEAVIQLVSALDLSPESAEAHDYLALAYMQQGRLHEATNEYATVVKLRPDFPEAHNNLGSAYALQGRLDEAVEELTAVLRLRPDLPEVHLSLGRVYARQTRVAEAIQEYRAALQLRPDFAPAQEALHALGISS